MTPNYRAEDYYERTEKELGEMDLIKQYKKFLQRKTFKVLTKTTRESETWDLPPLIVVYIGTRICSFMQVAPNHVVLTEKVYEIDFGGKKETKHLVDWLDEVVCLCWEFLSYYENPLNSKSLKERDPSYCWNRLFKILSEVGLELWW